MAGIRYKRAEARGRLPVHPDCRCHWIVVIPRRKIKPKVPKEMPRRGHLSEMPKDKAIEQFIKDAKLKGKVFTPKEAEEIWKHVKAYSGGAYRDLRSYQMNPAKFIRLQKPEFVKVIKKIDNNLGEFFKYSAKYKKDGILYRGINIDERAFSAFKKGRMIDMGGTSSFSSSKDVAQNFGNVIFKVENKTGASIKHIFDNLFPGQLHTIPYLRIKIGLTFIHQFKHLLSQPFFTSHLLKEYIYKPIQFFCRFAG
ncbi:hypothetical protein ES705_47949 [subsurface metagenome]